MRHHLAINIILVVATIITLMTGCNGRVKTNQTQQPQDTIYTQKAAMLVYDYDPVQALQIIDSAVIVGNLSDWRADKNRTRIYSQTMMGEHFDSLMHWAAGTRLDSACAIGERLLRHDSVKNSLEEQQDVLEVLVYTARQQNDTLTWLQRSQQLMEVCRGQGAETEALRNEAEVGAALCSMGRQLEGMAMLDSVIAVLCETNAQGDGFKFNELDALVIALKRKIGVMTAIGQAAEILPLARRIVTLLDNYGRQPDRYHDGTYREPLPEKREDYIRFYRSQAENFIVAAYAALGKTGDIEATFKRLESIIVDAEAREHHSRYRALEQKMEAQRQRAHAERSRLTTLIFAILLLAALTVLVWYWHQKRVISRKNRYLVRQMDEVMAYKEKYEAVSEALRGKREEPTAPPVDEAGLSAENTTLFEQIHDTIIRKQLYLNPACDRQMLTDCFQLTKEQIGALFAEQEEYKNVSAYINALRLNHASRLLTAHPDMDIQQVAAASGFGSHRYFSTCFKQRFGLSPTDYRKAKTDN